MSRCDYFIAFSVVFLKQEHSFNNNNIFLKNERFVNAEISTTNEMA